MRVRFRVDRDERDVATLEGSASEPLRGRRPDRLTDGSFIRVHDQIFRAASAESASTSNASSNCSSVITSGGMCRKTL